MSGRTYENVTSESQESSEDIEVIHEKLDTLIDLYTSLECGGDIHIVLMKIYKAHPKDFKLFGIEHDDMIYYED